MIFLFLDKRKEIHWIKMTSFLNHSSDYKKDLVTSASAPAATRKIIDYKRKSSAGLAPRFIFECAIKLNMKPLTTATSAIVFHRFFREVENESYDEYVSEKIMHILQNNCECSFTFLNS